MIEDGQVIDSGSYEELVRENSKFRKLADLGA
jgi:ABC-type multidrug transport system fused ATPase/permease subunit